MIMQIPFFMVFSIISGYDLRGGAGRGEGLTETGDGESSNSDRIVKIIVKNVMGPFTYHFSHVSGFARKSK